MFKPATYLLPTIYYLLFLSGCATGPSIKPPASEEMGGTYHRVERGQTLYGLSKMYNIDIDELAQINRISNAGGLEAGQLLFIPHRRNLKASASAIAANEDFIWPIKGRITSNFGSVSNNIINRGINIQPYDGNAQVVASHSGKAAFYSPEFCGYGKTLVIDHGDGFLTVYSSRSCDVFIKAGDAVQKGAFIANFSSGGKEKNGYMHFEIRKGHIPQNPNFYLP